MIHGYIEGMASLERRRYPDIDDEGKPKTNDSPQPVGDEDQIMLATMMGVKIDGNESE